MLTNLLRRPPLTLSVLRFGATAVAPTQKAFRRGDDETAIRTFAQAVLGRDAYERLPEARKQQMRENLAAFKAQMLGGGLAPLTADDLRRVRVPTLLLSGERSPDVVRRLTKRLAELLPAAERATIPAASHAMHEENPDGVNAAILRFVARHARDAAPA